MTQTVPGTPPTSPPRFMSAAALAGDLDDWGPLAESTGEPEVGVWECTPGPSYWALETHEAIHILSGRMTVTPDGGQPQDIGPGDCAVFPRGWRGTWQIHETIRKLYVLF